MKAIAICIPGLEEITKIEIKELLKSKSEVIIPSRVSFDIKNEEDLAIFVYWSRSITKAYLLFDNFKFKSIEDITKKVEAIKFTNLNDSFAVRCIRSGEHDFSSSEVEKAVGEVIFHKYKNKVDLEDPSTTVLIDISDNNCFIGIDFCGDKLSKRSYRIKNIPNPTNPCLAYCLVRIADYDTKDFLLDPFARSCEIPIEASLFALGVPGADKMEDKLLFKKFIKKDLNFSGIKEKKLNITAVDSLQNSLKAGEINSKLAGVVKNISFSRIEIEWLDTKFEEKSVDKIITIPPIPTTLNPIKDIEKIYKEFFYNSEFILKKDGIIVLATPVHELIEKYARDYKFKKTKDLDINYQNRNWKVMVFSNH